MLTGSSSNPSKRRSLLRLGQQLTRIFCPAFLVSAAIGTPDLKVSAMNPERSNLPTRERRPSMGAPIVDIRGSVGPAGISRPKHKRTYTGFGSQEIKHVEGMLLAQRRATSQLCNARVNIGSIQLRFPSLSVTLGPSMRSSRSRTRMDLKLPSYDMSRPTWLGVCSTATSRPPTRPPVWLSAIASS